MDHTNEMLNNFIVYYYVLPYKIKTTHLSLLPVTRTLVEQ
jgi:hypothetical protein